MDSLFFINSIMLGAGLAMDAFSVSLANGLNEPDMNRMKMTLTAGTYAFFQGLMPLAGWLCVHTVVTMFSAFETFIPYIALILLVLLGTNMIREAFSPKEEEGSTGGRLTVRVLLLQAVATSIDALSVGFTIAEYPLLSALAAAVIIAAVTFVICMAGLFIGRRFGTALAGRASVLGGVILIAIGIEIFLRGIG